VENIILKAKSQPKKIKTMIWGVDTSPSEFVPWGTDDESKTKNIVVIAVYTANSTDYDSLKQYKDTPSRDKLKSIQVIRNLIQKNPITVRGVTTSLENYVKLGIDPINRRWQSAKEFEVVPRKNKSSGKALVKSRLKRHREVSLEKEASIAAYATVLTILIWAIAKDLNNWNKTKLIFDSFTLVLDFFLFDDETNTDSFEQLKQYLDKILFEKDSPFLSDLKSLENIQLGNAPILTYAREVKRNSGDIIKFKYSGLSTLTDWITRGFYLKYRPDEVVNRADEELVSLVNELVENNHAKIIELPDKIVSATCK